MGLKFKDIASYKSYLEDEFRGRIVRYEGRWRVKGAFERWKRHAIKRQNIPKNSNINSMIPRLNHPNSTIQF